MNQQPPVSADPHVQQIHAAAQAVLCPTTSVPTRSAASTFLEQWNGSTEAWQSYPHLLEHHPDTRLLFLQLLQTKLRRDASLNPHVADSLHHTLQQLSLDAHTIQPACICLAALYVNLRPVSETVTMLCQQAVNVSNPYANLKILQNVPVELSLKVASEQQVAAQLQSSIPLILSIFAQLLVPSSTNAIDALQCLRTWMEHGRITLSVLQQTNVLPHLLSCLRTSSPATEAAATCLQLALQTVADACTPLRTQIVTTSLLSECLLWTDDSTVSLLCTLVCEEVDFIVTQPCPDLLYRLLQLQQHQSLSIRISLLEVWLTVSDVAVSDRHDHWKKPLYQQLLAALLQSLTLDQDDEDDSAEYRRLVQDVLIAVYYLLRSDYLEVLLNGIVDQQQEACVFSLSSVAREVHARVVSKTTLRDKDRTKQLLHQAIGLVVSRNLPICVEFVGAYAKTWSVLCSGHSEVLQILQYLQASSRHKEACRAAKSVLVACGSFLCTAEHLSACLSALMDKALSGHDREAMADIAEGCTRVVIPEQALLLKLILEPILIRADKCVETIGMPNQDSAVETASVQSLANYLHALSVVIRFSDHQSTPLSPFVDVLFPFLDRAAQSASSSEIVFVELIVIQQLLLTNAPTLVAPHFEGTVKYVVGAFEARPSPVCLEYLAVAVETLSSSNTDGFCHMLDHVAGVVLALLQRNGAEMHTEVCAGFFTLTQRYLLYSPVALVNGTRFSAILASAVECLESCKGERDSTRAALNFLTRIFSWKSLPSSESLSGLDSHLAQHGGRTVQLCVTILLGGAQSLWPSCTDCIYAVITSTPEDLAKSWMETACGGRSEMVETIVGLLVNFARNGHRHKAKAKMLLTDFSKIQRGELSVDALVSYSL